MAYPYLRDLVEAATGIDLPLPLPTFGLLVATALLVSMWLVGREVRRLHEAGRIGMARIRRKTNDGRQSAAVPPEDIVAGLTTIALLAGLIGARLFHILEYPREFTLDPWGMILTRSGFSFLGGLIFGTLAGVSYVKWRGLPVRSMCDAVAPALMLGYAIGRVGCQLSGDGDWGVTANVASKPDWVPMWLWAQTYDNNILGVTIAPPGVYPTPIYETLLSLVAFAILWRLRKHRLRAGWLFALYLLLAGIERLAIERIRVNAVLEIFGVHATQAEMISVALIALGLAGLAILSNGESRSAPPPHAGVARAKRKTP